METNENNLRILLCEGDENLGVMISEYLKSLQLDVDYFGDANAGYDAFVEEAYNICIFDALLFEKSDVVDKIHELDSDAFIIFTKPRLAEITRPLNAKNEVYISKPFTIQDLIGIIRLINRNKISQKKPSSLLQRKNSIINTTFITIGEYVFEVENQRLIRNDKIVNLTKKESQLLFILASNPNVILERKMILDSIWDYDGEYFAKSRSMDVYICKIRKYLTDDERIILVNIHGAGFKFIVPKPVV